MLCTSTVSMLAHQRLQVTKWQSRWTPARNCDTADWLALCIQHVRTSDLWQQLAELKGKTLVCDCPMKQMPSLGCTSMLVPCR